MQFVVDQRTLLKELNFLQGVSEKRATIPVLGHLLIEAESNRLRLQATNLDLSLTTTCEAAVAGEGSFCVPAKKLHEIVKSLPPAKVIFKVEENCVLHLTCERARFKLNGIGREQFPDIPTAPAMTAQLPAAQLRQIIARTLFAAADQDSRYSINGVKLELADSHLRKLRLVFNLKVKVNGVVSSSLTHLTDGKAPGYISNPFSQATVYRSKMRVKSKLVRSAPHSVSYDYSIAKPMIIRAGTRDFLHSPRGCRSDRAVKGGWNRAVDTIVCGTVVSAGVIIIRHYRV